MITVVTPTKALGLSTFEIFYELVRQFSTEDLNVDKFLDDVIRLMLRDLSLTPMSPSRENYVVQQLISLKGTLEIFNVISRETPVIFGNIDYFDSQVVIVTEISTVNPKKSLEYLEAVINLLLYFDSLSFMVEKIIYSISIDLVSRLSYKEIKLRTLNTVEINESIT